MSMINFKSKGDFATLTKWLDKAKGFAYEKIFDKYGKMGVDALREATPKDSGLTSESWDYQITSKDGKARIAFTNSNVQDGVPIAIIIQYGHATRNGSWVEGVDYINPALRSVFDELANSAWKEVTRV